MCHHSPWWRHEMEIFFCVTGLWEGNPPVSGGFPSQSASYVGLWYFLWFTAKRHYRDHWIKVMRPTGARDLSWPQTALNCLNLSCFLFIQITDYWPHELLLLLLIICVLAGKLVIFHFIQNLEPAGKLQTISCLMISKIKCRKLHGVFHFCFTSFHPDERPHAPTFNLHSS